ncbi:maltose acetyltransferase domain-containing protein [Cellulosimicrobium sp. PMB13]|uniref:maltose acetyltransferase domain-containing protein n=1 Tax=Cellulosimicrobium sp. PMB13 TaxID=3120158 RepID=UPI003F4C6089
MAAHELYTDHGVVGLAAERARATELTYDFNATRPSETGERERLLRAVRRRRRRGVDRADAAGGVRRHDAPRERRVRELRAHARRRRRDQHR